MSVQQLFKAVRIGIMVTLVSVSTLAFVQTERGHSIYAHYFQPLSASPKTAVVVSAPKDTVETKTSSSIAKKSPTTSGRQTEPTTQGNTADTADKPTGVSPQDKTTGISTAPGSTTGNTAAGTTGSAGGTTGSTTTGAAPSAVLVRGYNGQAADVRLKFVLDDLRVDLRKAAQEIAEAKGRTPALAVRTALDVIARSQDRTETLLDIARDIDVSRSLKGSLSPPEKAAALSPEPFTIGRTSVPKEVSSWLEPGAIIGIVTLIVAVLVGWFGDNLSGRFARKRDLAISLASRAPALAGPAETVQLERQPASATATTASMN